MESVKGCKLAAVVDGKPVLVSGVLAPGHYSGNCEHELHTKMSGMFVSDESVATSFALKP